MSKTDPRELETPKTFALITPIDVSGSQVTELTLREPTAGDTEQLQKDSQRLGEVGAIIQLIGKQTKLAPVDVRKIGARDLQILQDYLGSFFTLPSESSDD